MLETARMQQRARHLDSLAVETRGLRKVFGSRVAVEGLTLTVQRGEVFGFLGPNGAGKSTVVKMVMGLVHPTSGQARLLDRPLGDFEAKRLMGFLPENFRFHDWMTAEELLRFHGALYGMERDAVSRRTPEILALVGLAGRERDQLRTFSKGMQQRVGIAQALIGDPRIVFLDEPTSALDPLGRRDVREVIRHLKDHGVTVFLNSHLLSEVEMICDRVAIIKAGRIVQSGRLDDLLSQRFSLELVIDGLDEVLLGLLSSIGQIQERKENTVLLAVASEDDAPRVAEVVVRSGARLHRLATHRDSLENLFMQALTEGDDK